MNGDATQPYNQQINVYSAICGLVDCNTECCAVHFKRSFQVGLIFNRILKLFKTLYSKRSLKRAHLLLSGPAHKNRAGSILRPMYSPVCVYRIFYVKKIKKIDHLFNLPTSLENILIIY